MVDLAYPLLDVLNLVETLLHHRQVLKRFGVGPDGGLRHFRRRGLGGGGQLDAHRGQLRLDLGQLVAVVLHSEQPVLQCIDFGRQLFVGGTDDRVVAGDRTHTRSLGKFLLELHHHAGNFADVGAL